MTQLYRHFDAAGRLLYVGISLHAVARLVGHRTDSHWFQEIARVEITQYPDRTSAEIAEQRAINDEHPLHNIARDDRPRTHRGQALAANGRSPGLTDAKINAAKPRERPYKLLDRDGLYLRVSPTGHRSWRLRIYLNGHESMMSLGSYPLITLAMVRVKAFEARRLVAQGIDPVAARRGSRHQTSALA